MKRFAGFALLVILAGSMGCASREMPQKTTASADNSLQRVKERGVLLWGADVVGGVPYVYEDPENAGNYIGFEMEIATAVARELGVKQQLVIKAWDTLIPELQSASFDIAMNGIEDTADRGRMVNFSEPYFIYSQQITVRKGTTGIAALEDLKGKKVATLSGTAAEDILRASTGIEILTNPEIIYSYADLQRGKVDAVLLDSPIAAAYGAKNPELQNVGNSFSEGRYVIAARLEDLSLIEAVNQALSNLKANGELRRIFETYSIMDEHQSKIGVL